MNHLIISFSIMGGCTYAASSRHLWAYSRKDSSLFLFVLIRTVWLGAILTLNLQYSRKELAISLSQRSFPISHTMWLQGWSNYQEKSSKTKANYPHKEPSCYRHVHMCARVSSTIVHDELWCLELRRHNNLKEVGQTVQINASMGVRALHNWKLLSQSFHLALDLANP